MLIEMLTQKLNEYMVFMAYFPEVLWQNIAVSALSAVTTILLTYFLYSRQPVFWSFDEYGERSRAPQATKGEGGAAIIAVAASTYLTWQYIRYGNVYIQAMEIALTFGFFAQGYIAFTKLQANDEIGLTDIAKLVLKFATAAATISVVSVLLYQSSDYLNRVPQQIRPMNYFEFMQYFVIQIIHGQKWTEYALQQALGISIRMLIIYFSLGNVAYHIAVRFPEQVRSARRRRHLASLDSATTMATMIILSFISNDLLKGTFFSNMKRAGETIFKVVFGIG